MVQPSIGFGPVMLRQRAMDSKRGDNLFAELAGCKLACQRILGSVGWLSRVYHVPLDWTGKRTASGLPVRAACWACYAAPEKTAGPGTGGRSDPGRNWATMQHLQRVSKAVGDPAAPCRCKQGANSFCLWRRAGDSGAARNDAAPDTAVSGRVLFRVTERPQGAGGNRPVETG